MSYQHLPGMFPWREPQGPASDGRIRAMAAQFARNGFDEIKVEQLNALIRPDRLRFQEAVNALPTVM
jgi:hypothetical protein